MKDTSNPINNRTIHSAQHTVKKKYAEPKDKTETHTKVVREQNNKMRYSYYIQFVSSYLTV